MVYFGFSANESNAIVTILYVELFHFKLIRCKLLANFLATWRPKFRQQLAANSNTVLVRVSYFVICIFELI